MSVFKISDTTVKAHEVRGHRENVVVARGSKDTLGCGSTGSAQPTCDWTIGTVNIGRVKRHDEVGHVCTGNTGDVNGATWVGVQAVIAVTRAHVVTIGILSHISEARAANGVTIGHKVGDTGSISVTRVIQQRATSLAVLNAASWTNGPHRDATLRIGEGRKRV